MEDATEALTLAPVEPKLAKKRAKRAGEVTPERVAVLVAVYQALGTARLQAEMPAPHAVPYTLRKAHEDGTIPELTADSRALLRCREQLEAGAHGEPMTLADAETLLVATVRAKVHEHRQRDDDFSGGKHATIGALVVKSNFAKWIAAGRAWLASGGRPAAAPSKRGGAFTPRGEYTEL